MLRSLLLHQNIHVFDSVLQLEVVDFIHCSLTFAVVGFGISAKRFTYRRVAKNLLTLGYWLCYLLLIKTRGAAMYIYNNIKRDVLVLV